MRFSLLSAASALVALASARIDGISVPATVQPGSTVEVQFNTEIYIQSVLDVAVVFGISSGQGHYPYLGNVLGSTYLGPSQSNTQSDFSLPVTIPANQQAGETLFTAGLYSIYGVSGDPTLEIFNVTITVGDATSSNLVASDGWVSYGP